LRFRRLDMAGDTFLSLPSGAGILEMRVDGVTWPPGQALALQGAASSLLRLEIGIGNRRRVLRSLPTGRVVGHDVTVQ
jgi:hypothetical protein